MRLAEQYERRWGRTANASLCVTAAMQRELAKGWRVPATVFYDRPPDFFRPASLRVRRACVRACVRGLWRGRGAGWTMAHVALEPLLSWSTLPSAPSASASQQETHELLLRLQPALAEALHPADFVAQLYSSGQLAAGERPPCIHAPCSDRLPLPCLGMLCWATHGQAQCTHMRLALPLQATPCAQPAAAAAGPAASAAAA